MTKHLFAAALILALAPSGRAQQPAPAAGQPAPAAGQPALSPGQARAKAIEDLVVLDRKSVV